MIYLRAGLYAEGPTDYRFLMPLLDRLIHELAAGALVQDFDVADTLPMDTPGNTPKGREHALPAAISAAWGECTLFVIHADGAGDPERIRRTAIDPGLRKAKEEHPGLAAAACVPVRELEAWMLVDGEVFSRLLRGRGEPELPRDVEAELDPKRTLRQVLNQMGARSGKLEDPYDFFGANVRLAALRRLTAFQRFEVELVDAIRTVERPLR